MRRLEAGYLGIVLWILAGAGMFFLLLPILLIFPLSVDPGPMLKFPPASFSLVWYERYLASADWMAATALSLRIALYASIIATVVGTLAAVGMHLQRLPGRSLLLVVLFLPALLPVVVVAISIYGLYASLGLVGTEFGIALAHSVLCIPFVVLNVNASLAAIPRSYAEAAQSLGADPMRTVALVTLPLVWRGIAAGFIFAFVISFDEVVIAMFLSSISTSTLPKKMLDGIFFDLSPILAAISGALVIFNIVLAVCGLALSNASRRSAPA